MNLKKNFIVLILSLIIYSCDKDKDPISLEETEVIYEIIQQGNFSSSIDDGIVAQYLIFKKEDDWSEFYTENIARRNQDQALKFSQIDFDFENNTLVLVTSGYEDSCCKTIEINKVYQNQGHIYVDFNLSESDNSKEILSQSYILLKVKN